jgi:hypothetical protein
METWVIIVIVFIIVVVLITVTAIITALVKSNKSIIAGADIDEYIFKDKLTQFTYSTKASPDIILNPDFIQMYIDDYIVLCPIDDNPLRQLDVKIKDELKIHTLISLSDILIYNVKNRKKRRHPILQIIQNNIFISISVDYISIDGHIKYNIIIMDKLGKEMNYTFDLTDMDGVINLIKNTFNIVQGTPITSPLPRVKDTPFPTIQGVPSIPSIPVTSGIPVTPGIPSTSGVPSTSGTSGTPGIPGTSGTPGIPGTSGIPGTYLRNKYKTRGICNIL